MKLDDWLWQLACVPRKQSWEGVILHIYNSMLQRDPALLIYYHFSYTYNAYSPVLSQALRRPLDAVNLVE